MVPTTATDPMPCPRRARAALAPGVHALVPWAWFAPEVWRDGAGPGGDLVVMLTTMSAGFFGAGLLLTAVQRCAPGRHALAVALLVALASPFVAAVLVGAMFEPLAWFAGPSQVAPVGSALQVAWSLVTGDPARFVVVQAGVALATWWLLSGPRRPAARTALGGVAP